MIAGGPIPRVSVVVPVRNGRRYLGAAIESVLAEGGAGVEVIVVDDGSTDESHVVAAAFGPQVLCVRQEPSGIAAARNRGVALARAGVIGFVDADDLWTAGRLDAQLAVLDDDPNVALVFGHVRQFVSPDLDPERARRLVCRTDAVPGLVPGAMLARASAFDRVGAFSNEWRVGEFIDWYGRAVDAGLAIRMLPDVVLLRRVHDANHGIVAADARADYVRVVKAALDRRRAGTPERS